jgi:hypothetical protein
MCVWLSGTRAGPANGPWGVCHPQVPCLLKVAAGLELLIGLQVAALVAEARDPALLSRMYIGWLAFV